MDGRRQSLIHGEPTLSPNHPSPQIAATMSHYISLLRFTEQGAANLKKSTARAHTFDKLAAKSGVNVVGQYWTLGEYDGVLILSADSGRKVLHLLGELTSGGNVQTATLQAFTDTEFDEIMNGD